MESFFNKQCWKNCSPTCKTKQKKNSDPFLIACTKVKSKYMEELDIRPESINYIEENIIKFLTVNLEVSSIILYHWPSKGINKWHCIELRSFCTLNETMTRMKRHPTDYKKISAHHSCEKMLISKIYKALMKLYKWQKKKTTPLKYVVREEQKLPQRKDTDSQKYMKKWSTSFVREVQIKTRPSHMSETRNITKNKNNPR